MKTSLSNCKKASFTNFRKLFVLSLFAFAAGTNCFGEKITFNAKNMSGTAGNKNSSTVLKGDAKVVTETMEISADLIELTGKDFRYITATGKVVGKNTQSKMDFSCGKLNYDRVTKIAILEDKVDLVDTENNVSAKAEVIEYDQNAEVAVMQIDVELKQKENVCTCAHAIYRKKEQFLEMSGNPKVVQKEDTFRAQIITLEMNTQEISLFGRVKGSVTTEAKEKKDESKPEVPQSNSDALPNSDEQTVQNEEKQGSEDSSKATEEKQ